MTVVLNGPTRYRQRPPEVDALLVDDVTIDDACEWLTDHGITAYRDGNTLRAGAATEPYPLVVPFGHLLVHLPDGWRVVDADTFHAAHEPVRRGDRR